MSELFDLYNVGNVRDMFAELYSRKVFIESRGGDKTLEIINASFVSDKAAIFGKINYDYLQKEVDWYLTESQNINDMKEPVPELWKSSAGLGGGTNSNYGWAVFNHQNYSQYAKVLLELTSNPYSRRAVMIYTRPSMWIDYNEWGKNDFMCTNNVQFFIRANRLECLVYMRSNDAVFGYKCDRHWQMFVRDKLYNDLKEKFVTLQRGSIYWNAGSLHIYERHFYLVEHYIDTGIFDISKVEYENRKFVGGNLSGSI